MRRLSLPRVLVAAFLLAIPLLLTGSSLTGKQAFLPADLLSHVAPWKQASPPSAWNVLRFDGITQFYPWRLVGAQLYQSGKLPIWNPDAFAAGGGTPLWANSQSAPLYPLNAVFWLLPSRLTWYAFGLSAALHLLLAATGVYRLARSIGIERPAALFSATTFCLSGPVVCWLALPTFLCVSAWLPWLLLTIRRAIRNPSIDAIARVGAVGGLALLGGHLQIGLYVILSGLVYAAFLASEGAVPARRLGAGAVASLALVALLAAPQVLPSVELGRSSHRASASQPTWDGYRAYVGSALPIRSLVTFVVPDFYGNPLDGTHWNDSPFGGNNYAEWANYVGIAPLVLALSALAFSWRGSPQGLLHERRSLTALLGLSLALAFGTPLNVLTYFGVPGFSQTFNPARVLVVSALAFALLAGVGLQLLVSPSLPQGIRRKSLAIGVGLAFFAGAIGASQSTSWAARVRPDIPFGRLMDLAMPGVLMAALLLGLTVALGIYASSKSGKLAPWLAIGLALVDLVPGAIRYNPTSAPDLVYPVTPGIRWLQENARGALIAPLNSGWSMGAPSPKAVLPPNALTVFGLRDIAGYDSLFPAGRKDALKAVQGRDPSPPENGNMVFVKGLEEARASGAALIVTRPDAEPLPLAEAYSGDDMKVYRADWPQVSPPPPPPPTTALKVGLFLGAIGLSALGILLAARPLTRL